MELGKGHVFLYVIEATKIKAGEGYSEKWIDYQKFWVVALNR